MSDTTFRLVAITVVVRAPQELDDAKSEQLAEKVTGIIESALDRAGDRIADLGGDFDTELTVEVGT
jgi:hypothetical protein